MRRRRSSRSRTSRRGSKRRGDGEEILMGRPRSRGLRGETSCWSSNKMRLVTLNEESFSFKHDF